MFEHIFECALGVLKTLSPRVHASRDRSDGRAEHAFRCTTQPTPLQEQLPELSLHLR